MDRPLLLLSWVHELMLQRQTAGGLRMPAPILARVYTVSKQCYCQILLFDGESETKHDQSATVWLAGSVLWLWVIGLSY
jgi:hypothetical protein